MHEKEKQEIENIKNKLGEIKLHERVSEFKPVSGEILSILISGCRSGGDGNFSFEGDSKHYSVKFEYFEKEVSPGTNGMFDNVPSPDETKLDTVAFNVTGILPNSETELIFTKGTIMIVPSRELRHILDFQNDLLRSNEKATSGH